MNAADKDAAGAPRGTRRANAIAISGADGFIGRHLARHFVELGWDVRCLVRNPDSGVASTTFGRRFRCSLPDQIDPGAFRDARAVVHAAYATRHRSLDESRRVNEAGTAKLLALAREAGVGRFVFLSSTSAHAGAESYYARSKLVLEERLDLERDLVLRCGLVLGADGGLFQRLVDSLRRSAFVPVFDGGRQELQTVHVDDLCQVVRRCVEGGLSGRFVVAHPEAVSMLELMRKIATRIKRPLRTIPLPTGPVLFGLRMVEAFGVVLPVSSENLLGLRAMRAQPSSSDLEKIGVVLRSTGESLDDLLGSG